MDFEQCLSGYRFVRYLQQSQSANTILVQRIATDEQCVAKVSFLADIDEHMRSMFYQEAQLLQQLQSHQNIVRLIEFRLLPDYFVLVTEYANSGDLHDFIVQNRQANAHIKIPILYSIIGQIANALAFLKQQHIIHRDIKPANIFLHKNERSQLIVKVGDFGIAKMLDQTGVARTLIGTLEYVSPEFLEHEPYGYESDAWALGVVIYEMIALKAPFAGKNSGDVMQNIRNCRYAELKTDLVDIDMWLAGLLQVDPRKRMSVETILQSPTVVKIFQMLGLKSCGY